MAFAKKREDPGDVVLKETRRLLVLSSEKKAEDTRRKIVTHIRRRVLYRVEPKDGGGFCAFRPGQKGVRENTHRIFYNIEGWKMHAR